jgi:hypothetical protein
MAKVAKETVGLLFSSIHTVRFSAVDPEGDTALLHTAKYWMDGFINLWLFCSSKVTTIFKNLTTGESLIKAVLQNRQFTINDKEIFEEILSKKGLDPLEKTPTGESWIHLAIEKPSFIPLLLRRGAGKLVQKKLALIAQILTQLTTKETLHYTKQLEIKA